MKPSSDEFVDPEERTNSDQKRTENQSFHHPPPSNEILVNLKFKLNKNFRKFGCDNHSTTTRLETGRGKMKKWVCLNGESERSLEGARNNRIFFHMFEEWRKIKCKFKSIVLYSLCTFNTIMKKYFFFYWHRYDIISNSTNLTN